MDSLTQLTLGAAVGEATLGRKVGNRAMLWGAVAGTIPDLDVIVGVWMPPLDTLTFHRGPTHSLLFGAVFPLLLATYVHWLYRQRHHQRRAYRAAGTVFGLVFTGFVLFILGSMLLEFFGPAVMGIGLAAAGVIAAALLYRMWKYYLKPPTMEVDASWKDWYVLFFLATVTHPILDSFTIFGTQLFWPFSDMRVALGNISVADPLYTFPFLGFVAAAAFQRRGSRLRSRLNFAGLAISSLYMCFTLYNQNRVHHIFSAALAEQQIPAKRMVVTPSILNNVLWRCFAETDSVYYQGMYSFFDETEDVDLAPIPARHYLLADREDDKIVRKLKWFSDGFYALLEREDGNIQWNDMRYGTFRGTAESERDFIFYFILKEGPDGSLAMEETDPGPPEGEARDLMKDLWARIWGDTSPGT